MDTSNLYAKAETVVTDPGVGDGGSNQPEPTENQFKEHLILSAAAKAIITLGVLINPAALTVYGMAFELLPVESTQTCKVSFSATTLS